MRYTISARYGELDNVHHTPHTGIDFVMGKGEKIHSVSNGTIHIHNYGNINAGKTIFVDDENGHKFIYGHLSKFNVHEGQHVSSGDTIGFAGSTGNSTGNHLHFGLKDSTGHFTDPSAYIPNIEHMNDKMQITHHTSSFADAIHSQLSIYSDLLQHIKINFIHLIHSVDYSVLIQHFQNFFDLFF